MQHVTHYLKVDENEVKKEPGTGKSESLSDRDAGFCSGEETDLDTEYHSPTDHSHDSMDTTKDFITDTFPNKRKGEELSGDDVLHETKIIKLENCVDRASPCSLRSYGSTTPYIKVEKSSSPSPFRPWSTERPFSREYSPIPSGYMPTYLNCSYIQEEPLALVVEKKRSREELPPLYRIREPLDGSARCSPRILDVDERAQNLSVNMRPQEVVRIATNDDTEKRDILMTSTLVSQEESSRSRCSNATSVIVARDVVQSSQCGAGGSSSSSRGTASILSSHQQRNYKNMTRERRIEANARERTRVHTISAAFETLRNCIPAYANNQKLSKLSVLKVACSYIMTLSRIAGYDYSDDQSAPSLAECIDNVCNTIQLEGKTRKKKDD